MQRRIKKRFSHVYLWEKGNLRKSNEDAIYIRSVLTKAGPCNLYAICDGMGGYEFGKEASSLCVKRIDEWFDEKLLMILSSCYKRPFKLRKLIRKSAEKLMFRMNEELFVLGRQRKCKMGSTALVCILFQNRIYMFHIGDCAVYRMARQGGQMNHPQSINGNVLTNCLGINRNATMEFRCQSLRRKEKLLLCTDGFDKNTDYQVLYNLLLVSKERASNFQYEKRLQMQAKQQMQNGITDNMSAIYVWR